jgi:hypothetical protein
MQATAMTQQVNPDCKYARKYTANVSPIKATGKPRVTGGTP